MVTLGRQAQALADTQPQVVNAERQVSIADFTAQVAIKKAGGEAQSKVINAEAEATATKVTGGAPAARTLPIGQADAEVIKLKISSMESGNYALVQVAQALASSGQRLVPEIVAGGGGSGAGVGTGWTVAGRLNQGFDGQCSHR
jgi:uncharacterized membrane protein YqiK